MSDVFSMKRGDTSPSLLYALLPEDVTLAGASVVFTMQTQAGAVLIDRAAAVVAVPSGQPAVRYDWAAGDTDQDGNHLAEFEVTYADGAVETFPNAGNLVVSIARDLG